MNPLLLPFFFSLGFLAYSATLIYITLRHRGPVASWLRVTWEYQVSFLLLLTSHVLYYYMVMTGGPVGYAFWIGGAAFVLGAYRVFLDWLERAATLEW